MATKLPTAGAKVGFKADRVYSEAELRRRYSGQCGHWWGNVVKVEDGRAYVQYAHEGAVEPKPYSAYKFSQMFYVIPE